MKINLQKWANIQAQINSTSEKIERQEIEYKQIDLELSQILSLLRANFGDYYNRFVKDKSLGLAELEKKLKLIESMPNDCGPNLEKFPKIVNVLRDVYKIAISAEKQRLVLEQSQKDHDLRMASIPSLKSFVDQHTEETIKQ